MTEDFEPTIHLCRNGQAEHSAMFRDSLAAEDVEIVARRHVASCLGCALCTRGGVWHSIRQSLNERMFESYYR